MKKTTIKVTSIVTIIMLIMGALSSCFAAYVPLTKENITSALNDIETATSSDVKFSVEDSTIKVTKGSNNYTFNFTESDKEFTKEIAIAEDLNEAEQERIKPELLSALYGYIAASIVQGKSVTDSTNYIVSEIKKMDNYIRDNLVSEGVSTEEAQDESTSYGPNEILNSPLFNNILDGLASHQDGDVSYSDGKTFSLKIEKVFKTKVLLTLTILDNDFNSQSPATKSMSYNLKTILAAKLGNSNSNSSSIETPEDSSSSSSSGKSSTDSTTSKASKLPQTGRSYVANNAVIFAIILTFILIIGMIAYDVRKNKKN